MNSDTLKGQWKQVLGRAKTTWSKVTDDELLAVEGNVQRLSGLIQERYGIARDEAEQQIQKFIDADSDIASKNRTGARSGPSQSL